MRYEGSHVDGASTSPVTSFTVDSTTTTALGATPGTHWSNVPLTLTATTSFFGDLAYGGGIVTIKDTTTATVLGSGPVGPGAASFHLTTTLAQGPHHLVATYAGIDGIELPSEDAIDVTVGEPDLVTPRASSPTERILEGSMTDGFVPVRFAWVGDDGGSGIDHYQVRRRVDGGAWTTVKSSVPATHLDLRLAPWRRYQFEVRAIDRAGNASPWGVAPAFTLDGVPDPDARITYRGTWTRASGASWWNGTVRRSTVAGATATLKFTGRDAAWVTSVGPARGRARVYVDGVLRKTIDLYAAIRRTQVIAWSASWASAGPHTVMIRVSGTARAADGGRRRVRHHPLWRWSGPDHQRLATRRHARGRSCRRRLLDRDPERTRPLVAAGRRGIDHGLGDARRVVIDRTRTEPRSPRHSPRA